MLLVWIVFALVMVILISYICFRMVFLAKREKPLGPDKFSLPKGKVYKPFHETMIGWMKELRAMPKEDMYITSFDGLKLHASYYEYKPGAVMEIMFHGYRGTAERDLCGGVQRCFALGRNALVVDQRGAGESEGKIISFGVNESKDCVRWAEYAVERFGPDVKIILTGISMGASTVLMASGKDLPDNVIGILADCGFSSGREIICHVAKRLKLLPALIFPFIKLGGKLFGGFDIDECPPKEALKNCKKPVLFFHGETDNFVPCYMSKENFDVCPTRKKLVTTPKAGHGLCYPVAPEEYLKELKEFFE